MVVTVAETEVVAADVRVAVVEAVDAADADGMVEEEDAIVVVAVVVAETVTRTAVMDSNESWTNN
jgi:hypothetical protein